MPTKEIEITVFDRMLNDNLEIYYPYKSPKEAVSAFYENGDYVLGRIQRIRRIPSKVSLFRKIIYCITNRHKITNFKGGRR